MKTKASKTPTRASLRERADAADAAKEAKTLDRIRKDIAPPGVRLSTTIRRGNSTEADDRMADAAPALLHALTMVRDADNDRRSDGLPTIPAMARKVIDAAIAAAVGN